jgi:hypothetical protein
MIQERNPGPVIPAGGSDMAGAGRTVLAILLLLVILGCAIQAVAARELPDARVTYWLIDGTVGLASLVVGVWMLWPGRTHA